VTVSLLALALVLDPLESSSCHGCTPGSLKCINYFYMPCSSPSEPESVSDLDDSANFDPSDLEAGVAAQW
jgi:hypothetical protein